ncbi:MAG TPA: InlB B-repeat-containing protein [Oscillospiraceae bacterium]|nr:InlB B-repeat-containing protein [Oscillospiraceae bacterium]HPK34678.1 InlB B-repeat-containing protein [Oscillospiraceae bacterium]HPR74558.1 InlB B-repeat-containing protein [Oscillospiraceae bacterium]
MKKWKKISALLISLIMVAGLFSATVFATTTSTDTGCPLKYHIYYNGNGSTSGSQSASTGWDWEKITVKNQGTLQKTGYHFTGWNTKSNGTGESFAPGDQIDFIIVSEWVEGHLEYNRFGLPYWVPGYWHLEYGDRTLYAQWAINTYSVTFKTTTGGKINGGTADIVRSGINYGTSMSTITPTVTANEGYTFTGWTPALPGTVTSAGTYTANFSLNTYDVTFKTTTGGTINGGTADVVRSNVNHGTSMSTITPTVAADEGYTFTGWTPALPGTVTSAGTYTANFTLNTYDVTFKTTTGGTINGGTADILRSGVNHGTSMSTITPTVAADEGYTFTGWTPALPGTVTAAGTYTANFTLNTYDVTFKTTTGGKIDGSTADILRSGVTHGTDMSTIVPSVTADEGYTFTGWTPALPSTVTAAGTYTANFVLNTYDVTFKTTTGGTINGGTADILKENVDHGTLMSTIAPAAVADHGYTFAGWSPVLPETVTGEGTYTAQFTINQYTMTFNSMGGSAVAPITQNFNTEIAKPADPTLEHYTFIGWFDVEGNAISFPYTLTDDITVYAKWQINSYTMMFDSAGGTSVSPVRQEYGTQVAQPTNPTRYGFTFSGWYTGENGTGTLVNFPYTLIGNITVHARWTAGTFTMTFDSEGGSAVASISGSYGEYINGAGTPTKDGFTFEGWYSGDNGTGTQITFPYNITGDVTVYAKWAAVEVVSEPSLPATSSQPATTISENQTPTDVPSMGNDNLGTAAITIGLFSMFSLAGLAVIGSKKRKAIK